MSYFGKYTKALSKAKNAKGVAKGHEEIGLILGEWNLTQIYPMTDPWDISYITYIDPTKHKLFMYYGWSTYPQRTPPEK